MTKETNNEAEKTHQDENRLIKVRKEKLAKLKELGINPYPNKFAKNTSSEDIKKKYENLGSGESVDDNYSYAGRIMSIREMGKAAFMDVLDNDGRLQVYLSQSNIGADAYKSLNLFDIGDIVGVKGNVFRTKRGELSLNAKEIKLLAKSLRPLPEKFHGLKDPELRYRQRYVDLIINRDVKEVFVKKTRIIDAIREFLNARGYVEVETPILQPIYGGASARPFITYHNELKRNMYLRISNELYLKRLLVGGFEKVYEFSRDFRNEGIDTSHNPEFTVMETMCAYADYLDNLKLTEELLEFVAKKVNGSAEFIIDGKKISFKPPFKRISMQQAVLEKTGVDFTKVKDVDEAIGIAKKFNVTIKETMGVYGVMEEIFSELCEDELIQPTFVLDHPREISPLAKIREDNPELTERFELFVNGKELVNAYTELNDPAILRENWEKQESYGAKGYEEAQKMDYDFLRALEFGLPPCSGIGIGVDRLAMLLTGKSSIREVIFFPTLKEKHDF